MQKRIHLHKQEYIELHAHPLCNFYGRLWDHLEQCMGVLHTQSELQSDMLDLLCRETVILHSAVFPDESEAM